MLVGRAPADGTLPLITGAIPAISADEQRATLTFTQDSWAFVHHTIETDFPPDEQIVGWYHSHPGFGIFLSGHDLFIHENFFSGPSQIAIVVDPLAQTEGAFVWNDGEIKPLFERATPRRWVAPPEVRRRPMPVAHDGSEQPTRRRHPLALLLLAAVVVILLAIAWIVYQGGRSSSTSGGKATTHQLTTGKHGSAEAPLPAARRSRYFATWSTNVDRETQPRDASRGDTLTWRAS